MCGNDIKQATNIDISNPTSGKSVDALVNAAVNYMTLGLVGLEGGKVTKGVTTHAVDETVGQVSGRNDARKQIMEGKDALVKEAADRAQQLKEEQNRKFQQDVNASNYAASTIAAAQAQQQNSLGSSNVTKDFLGL